MLCWESFSLALEEWILMERRVSFFSGASLSENVSTMSLLYLGQWEQKFERRIPYHYLNDKPMKLKANSY